MTDIVIDQSPRKVTLVFVAGDALRFRLRIVDPDPDSPNPEDPVMIPRDLTGYSVAAQIRKDTKKDTPLLAEFVFNDLDDTGVILPYLTHEESVKLRDIAAAKWDFQLTDPSGDPLTIMAGPAKAAGDVTR